MILPLNPIIAETVNIDGIWYNLTSKVRLAEVTSNPNGGKYSGSIIIPDTVNYNTIEYAVKSIGVYSFYDCNSLKSVTIPEGVTSIGNDAFAYSSLASISISESVTTIGDKAFRGCSSLKSVTIPEGVTSIGNCVFDGCRNLTTITIPKCVTSIGDDAFHGCHSLKSISIPESVISIGKWTFYECINLTAINIPECITNIGDHAFSHCSSLKSITIPESVTNIRDGIFDCCNNLTSIIIPKNITSIGDNAFFGCSSLTTIILRANKLQSIGSRAFANCSELLDVYCYAETVPSTETNAFEGSYIEYATLHVPTSATESYKNTIPWSGFGKFETISIAVASITLSETSASLTEGESLTFTATVSPNDAKDKSISWSSSAPSVATVDNAGKVTAIAPGTATITAKANDSSGVSASCEVTVTPASYVITYLIDGEVFLTDTLTRGTAISLPKEPTKEGYTFSGWSEIPETMPSSNVTISGTFTINKYLVTFKIDDEVIASDSLEYGANIVVPEAPEKEGYTFNGWGEVIETVPASDVTYGGSYTINTYKVYYYVDEELVHTAEVTYGEPIPEYIYEPIAEGDEFLGWIGETYATMPAHDVTYTANIESGINQITIDNGYPNIYDLTGRKVNIDDLEELSEGIYIINGRKVVVKIGM